MSSILDALNKLEEEKAAADQPQDVELDEEAAEHELVGQSSWVERAHFPVTPVALALGALAFGAVLVAASVGASLYLIGSGSRPAPVVHAALPEQASVMPLQTTPQRPVPVGEARFVTTDIADVIDSKRPVPVGEARFVTTDIADVVDSKRPVPVGEARFVTTDITKVIAPAPTPTATNSDRPQRLQPRPLQEPPAHDAPLPQTKETETDPAPEETPQKTLVARVDLTRSRDAGLSDRDEVVPVEPQGRQFPASTPVLTWAPARPEPVDLATLPIVTRTDRIRLGLNKVVINVTGAPNKSRPRAFAIINLQKIYVGENIPGTRAKLIGASPHGVGIEVEGERFFLEK